MKRITDRCKNITLPQSSFTGSNNFGCEPSSFVRFVLIDISKRYNEICVVEKMNFLAPYSQDDEQFMEGEMADFLEELGFKICCHRRDFYLGVPIGQNIEDATVHSRRMICVISR